MVGALLHSLERRVHRSIACDDDHLGVDMSTLNALQEFHPPELKHAEVSEHQLKSGGIHLLQRFHAICGCGYLVAFFFKDMLQIGPGNFLIVHHHKPGFSLEFESPDR